LRHPHIVQIYEVGEQQGLPYFSLKYLEGGSLAQKLSDNPLPARQAAQLVEILAGAVQAAHERCIIHRDLKPGNILLTAEGAPKITDFGLAKRLDAGPGLTQSHVIVGTPSYTAPEQAGAKTRAIGPACDVYALGAILYELLIGRPPFRAVTWMDTVLQVVGEEPVPPRRLLPKLSRELETICLKALAKTPARRYASAREMAEDLGRFLRGVQIRARPVSVWEHTWRFAKRRPALAGLLAVSFLAMLTLVAGALWHTTQLRAALTEARLNLYVSHMNLAQRAWEDNELERVSELLEMHRPKQTRDKDLRGWEWYFQERLCQGDLRTLKGHTDGVLSVAFSSDGARLVSASQDKAVRLWDCATGHPLQSVIYSHTIAPTIVPNVTLSPDGARLASGSADGTVRLWDAASGEQLRTFKGHTERFVSAAFSADGKRIVSESAGLDQQFKEVVGEVKVWDVETGQELYTLHGHTSAVLSPDGLRLASTDGHQVKLWHMANGQELRNLQGPAQSVSPAAFSPDGTRLATTVDHKTIKLWDSTSGQELRTLEGHTDRIWRVVFSPDGARLASASEDKTVKLWDTASGQELRTFKGHTDRVRSVAFSWDGWRLAAGDDDGTVVLWDARPLTSEVSAEREAAALVAFHFNQPLSKMDVIETLQQNKAISEEVRKQALVFAHRFREEQDPKRFDAASRSLLRQQHLASRWYGQALRQAEAARRLAPQERSYLNTRGIAQYRLWRYREALDTLKLRADLDGTPADLAFLAMSHWRLGQTGKAQEYLNRLRKMMKQPQWAEDEEAQAFLREAETLLRGPIAIPQN
jgi:WD40 repeat protein